MFKLIRQLAWSNLVKNRQIYYPFALATILSVGILYIFISLTLNPELKALRGGESVQMVLGLGVFIVTLAVGAIVGYANGFVMKNRTKEMGLYEILGLNKGHLIHMMGLELSIFALLSVGLGLGFGLAFDQLIYGLLLKLMSWPVSLVSTFQWPTVFATLAISLAVFGMAWLSNLWKLARLKALELNRESRKGEKKSRFLLLRTLIGLGLMGTGYVLAITVKSPIVAIMQFFLATLLVIAGTYLLFGAGITVLLQLLKKRQSYYRPNNFIALSNLVFRMKKNAMGLATIAILSTMVLITLVGGTNIYMGTESFIRQSTPHAFAWRTPGSQTEGVTAQALEAKMEEFKAAQELEGDVRVYTVANTGLGAIEANQLSFFDSHTKEPMMAMLTILDEASYEKMTGQELDLADTEVLLNADGATIDNQSPLVVQGKSFNIKGTVAQDILEGEVPTEIAAMLDHHLLMVVKDVDQALLGMEEIEWNTDQATQLQKEFYASLDTEVANLSRDRQEALATAFKDFSSANFEALDLLVLPIIYTETADEIRGMMGSIFFIGILLSIIFMLGTVLVIYYKQISEGYEDRDNFIILQKVGLDESQVNQTIRKQVLTVFFLPLIFAFCHLLASFNMISKIIQLMVPTASSLIMLVALIVCLIFALVYLAVFVLTSRSYRRIVTN